MMLVRCSFLLLVMLSLGLSATNLAQAPAAPPSAAGPEEVTFSSGVLTLHGFIYKPAGEGPFPALLWNHGSEKKPGWLPELGALFTARGYVFFIPHRRGHGRSPGEYVMDQLGSEDRVNGSEARSKKLVELMEVHLADQTAALAYLKGLAYVDAKRVGVAGCSFGGIQALLAAGAHLGIRAAIDFAGAAQTWRGSPELRQRMFRAAGEADAPLLLIQAENDYDIAPSQELDKELQRLGKPHKMIIYPPFGATPQEGHALCVRNWEAWSADVFSFLGSTMTP